MASIRAGAVGALLIAAAAGPLRAQSAPPSPAEYLGYGLGDRFTPHASVVAYFSALDSASDAVEMRRYGTTPEGRPLLQVVIARPDRLARLDEILAWNRELTEPATPQARAREIARTNPAVLYFQYGVHGNEASSSEAAMWTAWDLTRGAESVAGVLDSAIVIMDPAVNPDGRDRYVYWYMQARGLRPDPDPASREHIEPWPGGRVNHYLFDLNRDWATPTQPETLARLATWSYWSPQVDVDFHEMNPLSSYFFFPPTEPVNPIYPEHLRRWARYFGEANAAAFDVHGWPYYTEESFDWFAPIYGDSWPSLLGAVGMTYEQAGSGRAGLSYRRPDDLVLTLKDRALHHQTAGEATARAAAARKTALLEDFAAFHRTQSEGLPDILLVPGEDPGRADALLELLRRQGIIVERARRSFRADAKAHPGFDRRREFPVGTFRVPANQPRGRLALTLLQPETVLKAKFSYDISAWSLPYAYGVEAHSLNGRADAAWEQVPGTGPTVSSPPKGPGPRAFSGLDADTLSAPVGVPSPSASVEAGVGYLVPPGLESWPGVIRYVRAGGRAVVLEDSFATPDRRWPAGTIFLPRQGVARQREIVASSGLGSRAVPVRSGLTTRGRDLGTEEAVAVRVPRLALLTGDGVSPGSFGAHWFFLERTLGLPFDAIPSDQLGTVDLSRYDVLLVPDATKRALDEARVERVKNWVEAGGTLVAVAGAAGVVAEPVAEITMRKPEEPKEDRTRALRGRKAREVEDWEAEVPGTIVPLRLDPAHPLAFGAGAAGDPEQMFVLQVGNAVFEPGDEFETVAHYPAGVEKVSGVISQENLKKLAEGSWLVTRRLGAGRAILFANDPLFRHFWYSAFQPLANALMLGPGM